MIFRMMLGYRRKLKSFVWRRKNPTKGMKEELKSDLFQPSVYHALVVIFLEFFSWGLLMSPVITVLNDTFGSNAFLMNGLIQGIKGILSFLSAPLIGGLSDVWGRKPFLLLTVTFTCTPIPLMKFSPMWYFTILSLSGVFSVTFSIIFAYVADITTREERSAAYGLVSATFAASLVTSPAVGAYLGAMYGDSLVIALASAIALLDVFFIMVAVPESLPESRHADVHHVSKLSWEKADPFGSLKKIGKDELILMLCVMVFLSYLPEAGEYSCFFVYLRLVLDFSPEKVAAFVAMIGVMSVVAQTALMAILMRQLGIKQTIIVGLVFEMLQLFMIGFFAQHWIVWISGAVAAICSITYPSISVFVSAHAAPDQQGVAQGVVTGIRGLCNGLGPALYGFIFYLFKVDLNEPEHGLMPDHPAAALPTRPTLPVNGSAIISNTDIKILQIQKLIVPGPPFVFGGILVIVALLVASFMPSSPNSGSSLLSADDLSQPISSEALGSRMRDKNFIEKKALLVSGDQDCL